jgi:hypothetical protein
MRNQSLAWVHIMAGSMLCLTIFVCEEEIFLNLNHLKVTECAAIGTNVLFGINLGTLVLPCSRAKCLRLI